MSPARHREIATVERNDGRGREIVRWAQSPALLCEDRVIPGMIVEIGDGCVEANVRKQLPEIILARAA